MFSLTHRSRARGLLGSGHRVRRVLGHGNEPAELFFARVGVERWKLAQVEDPLMPDVLNGMDVDLVGRIRWADLDVAGAKQSRSTNRTGNCSAGRPRFRAPMM